MSAIEQAKAGQTVDPCELLEALARYFPLIHEMESTPQDPEWHAEGNVRIHTERVISEAYQVLENEGDDLEEEDRVALIFGAALHDIGKTLTTREEERDGKIRIVSPRHTERGRSYAAPRMPYLGFSGRLSKKILSIVGRHHAPKSLVTRDAPVSAYWRLSRSIDPRLVYLFELADLRGRDLATGDDGEGLDLLELYREGAEKAGVWRNPNPYGDWHRHILEALPDAPEDTTNYVLNEAIRAFEAKLIFTPDEALSRTYEYRDNHPSLTITCGPSGAGKSTWVAKYCGDFARISLDELRLELTGKRNRFDREGEVLQLAKKRLREHLRAKRKILWDATTIRTDGRSMLVDLAHDYHASTRIVAFACPPEWVEARNRGRKESVMNHVITRQFDRLQWPEVWEAHEIETVAAN